MEREVPESVETDITPKAKKVPAALREHPWRTPVLTFTCRPAGSRQRRVEGGWPGDQVLHHVRLRADGVVV
jgi:hypothetical protein